jgi:hypothetical protein
MNTTSTAPDLREASNTYAHEVHRQGLCRVIRCREGIQWIVQTASANRPEVWRSESYCTTRQSLIREWLSRAGGSAPATFSKLPDHIHWKLSQTP